MTIVHVVGARPNFPKMAPVYRALEALQVDQTVVHTGQHFDANMSGVFFRDLGIGDPEVDLEVRGGSHAEQTARAMLRLETTFKNVPDPTVVVYGDVNSTLAGAIVGKKLGLGVVHVESGLRSRDMTMPEEQNRLMVDAIADLLLCTSSDAVDNLLAEGRASESIRLVGNTMIDSLYRVLESSGGNKPGDTYAVGTFHRPSNVDSRESAIEVVETLRSVASRLPLTLPLHPRSRGSLFSLGLAEIPNIRVVEPMGYREFCHLVAGASLVVTDSGGIQEETTALGIPCLTLRENTERPITILQGSNRLVSSQTIEAAIDEVLSDRWRPGGIPELWEGAAGPRAATAILEFEERAR
ncbi:non-hydrolyzing UDP-N-acetylglucosamine 2-epimerase [Cellulosimicrobium cellulans]|uniref:non-hydrolyzing UDP-N-acetylglucosamine 2-epimerase n=1 Tax=Cellulosimicrobium cellulans TaxID=1710 RepID=UPI0037FD250C